MTKDKIGIGIIGSRFAADLHAHALGKLRGYPQEMEDFADAVREGREPLSVLLRAHETVEAIYAGYVSAQEGRRVELKG